MTIILDTNPHAWALLSPSLPLTSATANILVFINAHLAINHANRVAVIASHNSCARFLYPTPTLPSNVTQAHGQGQGPGENGVAHQDADMTDVDETSVKEPDANKYRPFAMVERAITTNLVALISSTTPSDIASPSTHLSGALTLALSYISKQTLTAPSATNVSSSADATTTAGAFNIGSADGTTGPSTTGLLSRIMIISVSGGLAQQYIPVMNSIFACQRLGVPIDILALNRYSEAEFLEQAADATGGVYIDLGGQRENKETGQANGNGQKKRQATKVAGLLQTLMMAFLPDQSARKWLVGAGESEGVDFRAACFCHGRVVDLGWVCSICLSSEFPHLTSFPFRCANAMSTVFCSPLEDNTCLTCGTYLSMSNYGTKPVVVPKKKAKKKRLGNLGAAGGPATPASRAATPASEGVGTPAPR